MIWQWSVLHLMGHQICHNVPNRFTCWRGVPVDFETFRPWRMLTCSPVCEDWHSHFCSRRTWYSRSLESGHVQCQRSFRWPHATTICFMHTARLAVSPYSNNHNIDVCTHVCNVCMPCMHVCMYGASVPVHLCHAFFLLAIEEFVDVCDWLEHFRLIWVWILITIWIWIWMQMAMIMAMRQT